MRGSRRPEGAPGTVATEVGPAPAAPPRDPGTEALETHGFAGNARFRARDLLGRGGMGTVLRVFDEEMAREVALKTLPSLSAEERLALKNEFRSVAGLTHPNLVELYELFVETDAVYFTMELLEGQDFVAHVRGVRRKQDSVGPPRGAWVDRLLDALGQLDAGLSVIHAAGRIHRDIKPSNVHVTATGRVVLLDFGIALDLGRASRGHGHSGHTAGTLEYMAPEQMWGVDLTPAADFHALGVMLFEAITGQLPYTGKRLAALSGKLRGPVPRPSDLVLGVPPALDALVAGLLEPEPQRRATGAGVRRVLAELGAPGDAAATWVDRDAPFVGRERELALLHGALQRAVGGAGVLVRIEGPSGIGKTEVVRHFLAKALRDCDALALRGCCHPQESVPYKAFDGAIDALAEALCDLPPVRLPELAAGQAGALLRVFPALTAVPSLAAAPFDGDGVEPHELRRLAFDALHELLVALSRMRAVVVWIDDMQWGDTDSVLLLRELLERSTPALFLVAYRSEDVAQSAVLRDVAVAAARSGQAGERVCLTPLDGASAQALAASLLGHGLDREPLIDAVTAEAAGSPFFIGELARHVARVPPSASVAPHASPRLSSVVSDRLARLGARERRLVEVVAVAGGPIDRSLALRVAGLGEAGRPDAVRLGHAHLFRTTEVDGRPAVETYHDRIREAAIVALSPGDRARYHRDLATALRALPSPDPDALFRHHLGAGDEREAARFALAAAERASASLAFDRAAELFRHALRLDPAHPGRARTLERLAVTLVDAGRGAEAPAAFLQAADLVSADPLVALGLRRRAAEQLVRTGSVSEGTAVFERVLAAVGVPMPRSSSDATLRAAVGMLRLFVRGTEFRPVAAADLSPRVLERLDARWGACGGLGMMNPPVASALAVEHVLDALDAGEPAHVAYGLLYQAVLHAAVGGPVFGPRAARLLVAGEAIVARSGDPTLRGFAAHSRGSVAWHTGRFAEAFESCDRAISIYDRECRGTAWHRVAAENYALSALAFLGDLGELERRRRRALQRARDLGDTFGAAIFRIGQLNLARLGDDDPADAIADAVGVQASWPLRLYHHVVIVAQAELYRGRPDSALRVIDESWASLERDRILALELPRIELLFLRGRAALAIAAARLRADACAPSLPPATIARWARVIERSALPPAAPFAASLRAGLAWMRADFHAAKRALRSAIEGFDAAALRLHACASRIALAGLEPHSAGARAIATDHMRDLGVTHPGRMTAMLVPWLPEAMTAAPRQTVYS